MSEDEMICYCSNVTKQTIIDALEQGANDIADIRKITGACTLGKCKELSPRRRCCSKEINEVINEYQQK